MEKIAVSGNSVVAAFLQSVVSANNKHHLLKGKPMVDVQLSIGGEVVSITQAMDMFNEQLQNLVEARVLVKASELVTGAGLQSVVRELEATRVHVLRTLAKVKERCPDDVPRVDPL